jgi:hypothetical protein
VEVGRFCILTGTGAGECETNKGVAVNQTGNGGVDPGDVYVADSQNDRIDVFSASGQFGFAFGLNVGGAGVDTCTTSCAAGSASGEAGSVDVPQGIAIDQVSGDVYVTSNANHRVDVFSAQGAFEGAFGWKVKVTGAAEELQFCTTTSGCQAGTAGEKAGQFASASGGLTNSLPAVDPSTTPPTVLVPDPGNKRVDVFRPTLGLGGEVTAVSFVHAFGWDVKPTIDEIQEVKLSGPTGGSFALGFKGEAATVNWNATTTEVQGALAGLATIGGTANVAVTGSAGAWKVEFKGSFAGQPQPLLTADAADLTPPPPASEATVTRIQEGANGTGTEFEVCTTATTCKGAAAGAGNGQFSKENPTSVAVAPGGTIYAANPGHAGSGSCSATEPCRVEQFTQSGGEPAPAGEFAPAILSFTAGKAAEQEALALAVDPADGHVYVARKVAASGFRVLEFEASGALVSTSPAETITALPGSGTANYGLAVGTAERLYLGTVNTVPAGQVYVLGPIPPPAVEILAPSGVESTCAEFNGKVTVPAPGGEPAYDTGYHFEYSADGIHWTSVPTRDVGIGDTAGTQEVHQRACGLSPNTEYQVRLVGTTGQSATSASETFLTKPAPPLVTPTSADPVGQTDATLSAFVNPQRSATSYHFEWGTTPAYGNRVPGFERQIGAGGEAILVQEPITGLQPDTTYHFRAVATNFCHPTEPRVACTTFGPDQEFATLGAGGLPDNRAAELVSPAEKGPVAFPGTWELAIQLSFQAAADGNGFYYPVSNGLTGSTAGGDLKYLARRSSDGWQSSQITPPALVTPPGPGALHNDGTGRVLYYNEALSCGVVETFEPLTADTPAADREAGVFNLYQVGEDGDYTLLTQTVPSNPGLEANAHGVFFEVTGSSADCSHVVFESGYVYPGAAGGGLYESSNGMLRGVGLVPGEPSGEVPATRPVMTQSMAEHPVSGDGDRAFFAAASQAGADKGKVALFVREGSASVDISQSQTSTVDNAAVFQGASADGGKVLFLANYGLTSAPSNGATSSNCYSRQGVANSLCDLYEYDFSKPAGGRLTDLSADANSEDPSGARVAGVLGFADDGSYVYFAALGQLVAGEGNTYAENLAGKGAANVYLSHDGRLFFVGTVSASELASSSRSAALVPGAALFAGGSSNPGEAFRTSSRVTPGGGELLFVSSTDVTGYQGGGVPEAYLYSAESQMTVCLSCRPDGLPSVGKPEGSPNEEETAPIATNPTIPYQQWTPRALSANGRRVFFTMPDVLAAGAVSGARNVYEWVNGQIYLLDSGAEFIDASDEGDDVFILTQQQLAPQDRDNSRDVYDLRAGGGFPYAAPPSGCEALNEGGCQGASTPQPPGATSPPTTNLASPGNGPAPPPAKTKRHKKHHRHKKQHKSRKGKRRKGRIHAGDANRLHGGSRQAKHGGRGAK